MKLGDVLKKERERRNVPPAAVADRLGITVDAYEAIEAGENAELENVATLVVRFNDLIEGQVNQLFYPCGLPFSEIDDYSVR